MSRKYSKEFKDSIIKMVKDGADARNLSAEYGPNYQTIRRWVRDSDAIINPDERDIKKLQNDNALIENFHSMLKREWVFHQKFISIAHARLSIIQYIEWFNHERISYREMAKMKIS